MDPLHVCVVRLSKRRPRVELDWSDDRTEKCGYHKRGTWSNGICLVSKNCSPCAWWIEGILLVCRLVHPKPLFTSMFSQLSFEMFEIQRNCFGRSSFVSRNQRFSKQLCNQITSHGASLGPVRNTFSSDVFWGALLTLSNRLTSEKVGFSNHKYANNFPSRRQLAVVWFVDNSWFCATMFQGHGCGFPFSS